MIGNKTVLYFVSTPLSQNDFDRFGIKTWIEKSWEVFVIDITKFMKPDYWAYVKGDKISVQFDKLYLPENFGECSELIKQISPKVVIDLIYISTIEKKIRKLIPENCIKIRLSLGSIPQYSTTLCEKLRKLFEYPQNFSNIKEYINNKYNNEFKNHKYVIGGSISLPKRVKSEDIIYAHNFDYDLYLKWKESNPSCTSH